ncbi:hypothetical protein HUJ05_009217 [Dendroctonus ponderosae]|nr:hypothetical protein HUJ05_009217 [Dendroctonus ponderosae]
MKSICAQFNFNKLNFEESFGRMSTMSDYERIRLVILGGQGVGKSCIIKRFLFNTYCNKYRSTVEDLYNKEYDLGHMTLKVDILDTAGDMQFPAMRRLCIATAHAFLLVYSVASVPSFDCVKQCFEEIRENRNDYQDIPIVVAGNKLDLTTSQREITIEDVSEWVYCELPKLRFESHGGGWGYSGHSIEAIRFMADTDILLGGFGLFGGRGEYTAKLKLLDIGPNGGEQEVDGELLTETEEVPYECGPRQKYAMLFEEPVQLQAHRWYVAWCRISGPSSDCGSSGQTMVTTEDQVLFYFKSSKKSNNGTDVNAGQIPQFESHGGGWGYSGHSIEAIRFMADTDILLGGFGLFGGRGEYTAKLKLLDIGPNGGEQEVDGELLTETEEVPYECGPRQKYAMLFEEPVQLQAHRWYVAWCRISGPSSDCGSSGQTMVTTEDQVLFYFKSSKKSNNGTDVNAGQIPQLLYKIVSPENQSPPRQVKKIAKIGLD